MENRKRKPQVTIIIVALCRHQKIWLRSDKKRIMHHTCVVVENHVMVKLFPVNDLNRHRISIKVVLQRQSGVQSSKYIVVLNHPFTCHVIQRMRSGRKALTMVAYGRRSRSRNASAAKRYN